MHGVWDNAKDKNRVRVTPAEAVGIIEADFTISPEELWTYITDPVTRTVLIQSDWQKLERGPKGGMGPGATYVCAHGDRKSLETIVDWEPLKTYTVRTGLPLPNVSCLMTYEVIPKEKGSRLRMISAHAVGPFLLRHFTDIIGFKMASQNFEKGVHALKQRILINRDQVKASSQQAKGSNND
jgi:hypothetical protein